MNNEGIGQCGKTVRRKVGSKYFKLLEASVSCRDAGRMRADDWLQFEILPAGFWRGQTRRLFSPLACRVQPTCPSSPIAPPSAQRYCYNDMSFRKSFSGFRKKVKDKLSRIGDKTARGQADPGGEGSDHPTLSLQSEPGVIVGGEFRGGDVKVSAGKDDPRPDDLHSVSRSAVGVGRGQGATDDKASGETSQKDLHPHPHVQTEGGSSREVQDVDREGTDQGDPPPQSEVGTKTPAISTSHAEEPESTWITSFQLPCLTDDVGNPAVPDPALVDAATSKDKSDWKHTASSAAKLFLRTVERASDAFPPLKSTAAGLCAILDNCEVWSTFIRSIPHTHGLRSKR